MEFVISGKMSDHLNLFQKLILFVCLYGQFLIPFIFTVIYYRRAKIPGSKYPLWKFFLLIILMSAISIFVLDIITLLYCIKAFQGSGNFGFFIFPLFFIINLIIAILVSIIAFLLVKNK